MINCLYCNKETNNPKFCCKSCAATYNNKIVIKRQPKKRYCKKCGIELPVIRSKSSGLPLERKHCPNCSTYFKDWSKVTLQDIHGRGSVGRHSTSRNLSQKIYMKSDKPKQCFVCGYSIFFEVCHIKPVSSFSKDTPISIINDIDNLVALCPNHHWEFDHGMLILDIDKKQ